MPLSLVPLGSAPLPLFCSETLACSDTLVTCLDGGGALLGPVSVGTLPLAPATPGAVTGVPASATAVTLAPVTPGTVTLVPVVPA